MTLQILIHDRPYEVQRLAREPGESLALSIGPYRVSLDDSGTWHCSCPDWQYRPSKRPCKHVRCALAIMALVYPPG